MSGYAVSRSDARLQAGWFPPLAILALAVALRLVFFRGSAGTDELTYLAQGLRLLHGDVGYSHYIGALRYGINGLEAGSVLVFGNGVGGADIPYMLFSLGEVLLTYWFALHLWGPRAAAWSGLAIATLPLDVALAGSFNPDCYLGFVISASVVAFYFAQRSDRAGLFLLSGLLAGWVFWIKQEVIIFGIVFAAFAIQDGRWRRGYLWFGAGGLIWLVLNLAFFGVFLGDPLLVFHVLTTKVGIFAHQQHDLDTAAWSYPVYLLVKLYHVGLVGWLALAGAIAAFRQKDHGTRFVLIWACVLVLVFSLFPFSFSPFRLIPKQTNYMTIFMVPLAMLAGWFLSRLPLPASWVLGCAMIVSGVLLSALEQQVIQVSAANEPAEAAFAEAHAGIPVYGPMTAQKGSLLQTLLRGSLQPTNQIQPTDDLPKAAIPAEAADSVVAYVITDPQMRDWAGWYQQEPLPEPWRHCLVPVATLSPDDLGLGRPVVSAVRGAVSLLPHALATPILGATASFWQVQPARVFSVTRACALQAAQG